MLREAAGLSVAELARRIGIRQPSLWLIEDGQTKTLRASTLMRLAEVLNADPAWISTGRGAPYRMTVAGPGEAELISIYRNLSPGAQAALMGAAKGMIEAAPKATPAFPFRATKKTA